MSNRNGYDHVLHRYTKGPYNYVRTLPAVAYRLHRRLFSSYSYSDTFSMITCRSVMSRVGEASGWQSKHNIITKIDF